MSEQYFPKGGQYCRNGIKKASFRGWSTSPEWWSTSSESVITMDRNIHNCFNSPDAGEKGWKQIVKENNYKDAQQYANNGCVVIVVIDK